MPSASPPFAHSAGPRSARVALVAEAWGKDEEELGRPLVGPTGRETARLLHEAGLVLNPIPKYISTENMARWWDMGQIFVTNTLALRPPQNNMDALCTSKKECGTLWPSLKQGKYLRAEFVPEIIRLYDELSMVQPNIVIALGATACWALLSSSRIGALRGVATWSTPLVTNWSGVSLKVLPTYHPAAVFRNWGLRPVLKADLMKARQEAAFRELRRPERVVRINPTITEIQEYYLWLAAKPQDSILLAFDIETGAGQIKCIGFAASAGFAICVPFVDLRKPSGNYWDDEQDERAAWMLVRAILQLPCPKLGQNVLYDIQYLWRMGIRPVNVMHDSMLLHHSIFPELPKGLGFLGSIYTQEASWKLLREREDTSKTRRDE